MKKTAKDRKIDGAPCIENSERQQRMEKTVKDSKEWSYVPMPEYEQLPGWVYDTKDNEVTIYSRCRSESGEKLLAPSSRVFYSEEHGQYVCQHYTEAERRTTEDQVFDALKRLGARPELD